MGFWMELLLGTLGAALLCAGLWLGFQLVLMSVVMVQTLRLQFHPQRLQRGELPEDLPPDQQAAVDEVRALGFSVIATGWHEHGPSRSPALLFRHEAEPAFASLLLMPGSVAGYILSFFSLDTEGVSLSTGNRSDWLTVAALPAQKLEDAWASTPAEHWKFHRARIAGTAIQPLSDEEAWQHCAASYESYVPMLLERGLLRTSQDAPHLAPRAAAGVAWRWRRVRHKLAVPYISAATEGPHQASYDTQSYLLTEATLAGRPSRHSLKATVLVVSAALTLLLWSWAFSWQSGLAVLVILLLHEGGHALAMRAFGYRDMSMFFIPFLGAVVTGRPREIVAWKQALVLLAGPLPGLLLGLGLLWGVSAHPALFDGFDWRMVAVMAIGINLFNLLPLTPLDGGQLMELSLFSRWPRSRLVFSALSVLALLALALWFGNIALGVVGVALGFGLVHQLRVSRLDQRWQEGLPLKEQLEHLFGQARQLFGARGFLQQYPMVRAVVERRKIARPRLWESLLVLALLVPLWGGLGYFTAQRTTSFVTAPEADTRSAQQRAFDERYQAYRDSDDENGSEARLDALLQARDQLEADDPRRVDLRLMLTWEMGQAERSGELERLLAEGREGSSEDLEDIERQWLDAVHDQHREAAPSQRAAALASAISRGEELLPKQPAGTIEARLRHAEQIDLGGDPQAAETLLAQIRHLAERSDDCRCELRRVLTAQAWYFLSHDRPRDAVTVIEASPVGRELRQSRHDLSTAYAWALLESGQVPEGIEQMRTASYGKAPRPSLLQRLGLADTPPPRLHNPLDLAYALRRGPQPEQAQALMTRQFQWLCEVYSGAAEAGKPVDHADPWQQLRERRLTETAQAICPPEPRPADSGPAKETPAG